MKLAKEILALEDNFKLDMGRFEVVDECGYGVEFSGHMVGEGAGRAKGEQGRYLLFCSR